MAIRLWIGADVIIEIIEMNRFTIEEDSQSTSRQKLPKHFHSSMVSLLSKTVETCNELPFMLFAVVRIALPLFEEV